MTEARELEPVHIHHLEKVNEIVELPPWSMEPPLMSETIKERTCSVALYVAERLTNLERTAEFINLANKQTSTLLQWFDASLAGGFTGLAIMYGYVDQCFPGQGWDRIAYTYMKKAADSTRQAALLHSSLFSGTAGIAMGLHLLSRGTDLYKNTQTKLNALLYQQIIYQQRIWRLSQPCTDSDYDLISGASGLLLYLVSLKNPDEYVIASIEEILTYLTYLAEPGQTQGAERWYLPVQVLPETQRKWYPEGQFNCGLAHGIPGPLAALSIAWLSGYRYPGLREAIAFISHWLVEHQVIDACGINWPDAVPRQHAQRVQDWQTLPPARAAWCYGTPGIASSLYLAGKALQDNSLCHIAVVAIEAVMRRPALERCVDSPTICHGQAGLLHICLRFAHATRNPTIMQHIPVLLNTILEVFSVEHPLGFRDWEKPPHIYVDQPGWLTGAPGVAMVLLAAVTGITPQWDRILALA